MAALRFCLPGCDFLPGFWSHALLYLGPEEAWTQLERADGTPLGEDPLVKAALGRFRQGALGVERRSPAPHGHLRKNAKSGP